MTVQTDAIIAGFKSARSISGVTITYTRGVASVVIRALRGQTQLGEQSADGIVSVTNSSDYFVLASDLVLSGSAVLPARGDTITDGGETFTVLCLASEPQWRYTDHERVIIRIHTKEL